MGAVGRAVSVLALSSLALAGCGSSGGGGGSTAAPGSSVLDPTALVAASYQKITTAKTAKVDLTFQLTQGQQSGGSGSEFHFTGTGAQNFADKAAQLTLSVPTGEQIEERVLGTTVYEKLPATAAAAPQLKGKWLKIDLNKAAQQQGLGSLDNSSSSDPSQIFKMLSSVSDGVIKVGDEKVRDVDTTHYRATVNLDKVGAQQGYSPAQVAKLKQLMGTSNYPVDVWIDKGGLPHRVQFNQPLPTSGAAALPKNGRLIATEEFYDFGVPVSVQAPPASQTVDAFSLPGARSSAGSSGTSTAHA